jgi:hypothetical protein
MFSLLKTSKRVWLAPALVALLTLGASGCSSGQLYSATSTTSALYCTVNAISQVSGTNQFSITVLGSNGTPNYSIASVVVGSTAGTYSSGTTTFASSGTVAYTFSGYTAATLSGAAGTVSISDATSPTPNVATCTFTVPTAVAGGLACTLLPTYASIAVNSTDNFTVTPSGGTSPYTFSGFTAGTGGTAGTLTPDSSNVTATDSAIYSTAGVTATAAVTVTDSASNSISCSTAISVTSISSASILASPNLVSGESMTQGQYLYSTDGNYWLTLQTDGNLVLYQKGNSTALWSLASSFGVTDPGVRATMGTDGNFVVADANNAPTFATATAGNPGAFLQVQTDGNLVVYNAAGVAIWSRFLDNIYASCGGLASGAQLVSGQTIISCTGGYSLRLMGNGNLVMYDSSGNVLFQTATANGSVLRMQTDGNLVLATASNALAYQTGTFGQAGAFLAVQSDGNLVIYSKWGLPLWTRNTGSLSLNPGGMAVNEALWQLQTIFSNNDLYRLTLQADGNLVFYNNVTNAAIWASGTTTGHVLIMQTDGNLVLYDSNSNAVWASNTSMQAGASLAIQNDGNLVLYSRFNRALWILGTSEIFPCGNFASGWTMSKGQAIYSCDGNYEFTLQGDGNLVEYGPTNNVLFASNTVGLGYQLRMQTDGNLVLATANNALAWMSSTYGQPGAYFSMQTDGNGVIYNLASFALFSTTGGLLTLPCGSIASGGILNRGQSIFSCDLLNRLTLQGDGNLVLYNSRNAVLWTTKTSTGFRLVMQTDGNLVLRDSANNSLFSSATSGHAGATLAVKTNSTVDVVATNGSVLWSK